MAAFRYVNGMEHTPTWLVNSFIYLTAAVIAVPLSRALGLGAIIGYLAAGMAIGPWGLRLVSNVDDILHFAEFGVVLMLFLVGLERRWRAWRSRWASPGRPPWWRRSGWRCRPRRLRFR